MLLKQVTTSPCEGLGTVFLCHTASKAMHAPAQFECLCVNVKAFGNTLVYSTIQKCLLIQMPTHEECPCLHLDVYLSQASRSLDSVSDAR